LIRFGENTAGKKKLRKRNPLTAVYGTSGCDANFSFSIVVNPVLKANLKFIGKDDWKFKIAFITSSTCPNSPIKFFLICFSFSSVFLPEILFISSNELFSL
jgi:hypothetical protein